MIVKRFSRAEEGKKKRKGEAKGKKKILIHAKQGNTAEPFPQNQDSVS